MLLQLLTPEEVDFCVKNTCQMEDGSKSKPLTGSKNNEESTSVPDKVRHLITDKIYNNPFVDSVINPTNITPSIPLSHKCLTADNSTNNNISFMPFWNNKTLHLIIDTNIGSTQDFNENVFTSGTTFGTVMSAGVEIVGAGYQYNEIPITGDTSSGGIKIINDVYVPKKRKEEVLGIIHEILEESGHA